MCGQPFVVDSFLSIPKSSFMQPHFSIFWCFFSISSVILFMYLIRLCYSLSSFSSAVWQLTCLIITIAKLILQQFKKNYSDQLCFGVKKRFLSWPTNQPTEIPYINVNVGLAQACPNNPNCLYNFWYLSSIHNAMQFHCKNL